MKNQELNFEQETEEIALTGTKTEPKLMKRRLSKMSGKKV